MTSKTQVNDANFLVGAELSAQAVSAREFISELTSLEDAAKLCAAMNWPYVRPLLELQINDAVDASGGLILQALGFARMEKIFRDYRSEKGREFSVISLTEQGHSRLDWLYHCYSKDRWFAALEECIEGYDCRDLGAGIAIGADFLTSAIQYDEADVLGRVITPDALRFQFSKLKPVPRTSRSQVPRVGNVIGPLAHYRSPPKVIQANFDLHGGGWTKNARDTADDLVADFICVEFSERRALTWSF